LCSRAACPYCASGSKHPLFAYLLSDARCVNNPSEHSIVPYIGLSSNPFAYLHAHNRDDKRYTPGSQLTKPGAGNYQLELVCGPLFHGGQLFRARCRKNSRKIVKRMLYFCDYAARLQRESQSRGGPAPVLYARDVGLIQSLYDRRRASEMKRAPKRARSGAATG
jgi:hypothetical protein